MTTAATSLLGLALPVTGELAGTWGDTVNNSITSLLDTAVAGTTTISTDADVTLTTTTLAANQARQAIILWTANGSTTRNITAPAQSKIYTVINASAGTQSIVLRGAGPTAGVTILKGESAICAWNGSDFIKVSNTAGAGSFTDLTVSGSLSLTGGTANGVLYLNGSKVATSGSALTFDGTNPQTTGGWRSTNENGLYIAPSTNTLGAYGTYTNAGGTAYVGLNNSTGGTFGGGAYGLVYYHSGAYPHMWYINGSEQMRLTSTGLGIGTSSPSGKLHISGYQADIWLTDTAGTANTWRILAKNGVTNALRFYDQTVGAERMVIDASGNLGLGVTPSAWSGVKAFQLTNGTSSIGIYGAGGNEFGAVANTYYNGTNWIYSTGTTAARYAITGGQHQWFNAPSGTAGNPITFTQAMTLDASGNLGLGTTSAVDRFSVVKSGSYAAVTVGNGTNNSIFGYANATDNYVTGAAAGDAVVRGYNGVVISGNNGAGAVRIDSSGNLLVGTTSTVIWNTTTTGVAIGGSGGPSIQITRSGDTPFLLNRLASDGAITIYARQGTQVGSVEVTTTSTSYNTSSDYRLKEAIAPMTGALAKVAALKPVTYKWKADGSDGQGFIAHELAEVVPQCVTGEKDAVDAEGKPLYQGIDTSFLVATLTAALQELKSELDSVKAELATLKGN